MEKNTGLMTVRFSIGAKLITIITIIVLMSLGSIIALVSWLVREDLRIAAEDNNFEANRRSAIEAELTFNNIRLVSQMLMRSITEEKNVRMAVDFFFERNPHIAAVYFSDGDAANGFITNEQFFEKNGVDALLAETYLNVSLIQLQRAASGETIIMNSAPHFTIPLLTLFFPLDSGGSGVLFSPAELNDAFGSGINQSYLINDRADILLHSDFELLRNGTNVSDQDFIKNIWKSPSRSEQSLYDDQDGLSFFGAFTKLNIAGAVVITSIEAHRVFEGIEATTRRNIYLTVAVLSISIILIWFFSKSISEPLKTLAAAAHTIEGGDFNIELKPKGHDEIGVLTASFLRMCKALGIFGRFTNRDIALRAMRGEIKPGGSPKLATIFFSDIRNFTAISENFTNDFGFEGSDRIVQWLNEYFTRMVNCVEKTGGVVDKFIGDALMAHWGTAYTTGSARRDAYNCISAALQMRLEIRRLNKSRKPGDHAQPRIHIGCGINTGMVTAGQIGSEVRMEYTVTGDPVNLASRVESLNKPLGTDILITEDTWRLVRTKFITQEMPPVMVKGKEKPVRIFAVINYAKAKKGPKSLGKIRRILGIRPPDLSKVDVNADEKKASILGTG